MAIVAVGSIAFDSVASTAGKRERILGGSLTHFSNAASLKSKPRLVGVVGEDFGDMEMDFLKKKSSSVEGVEMLKGEKSFFWKGHYTENFDSAVTEITELNAFAKFNPVVPESYKTDDYILFLANISPDIQTRVAKQCPNSKLKMLDTMNYWIESTPDDLQTAFANVDGIIINEGEAELLTGEKNLIIAAKKLFLPHFKLIILKKGSNGVMVFGKNYIVSLPAFPLTEIIDPTGAGDSFAGAFLSYIDAVGDYDLSQETVKQAAVYATIVASHAVQGFGVEGIDGITTDDVEKRIDEFRKIASFE